ncbi:RidA family protein [Chryseobacterium populi]|uniref:Putative translation initiation inhibitor, yjgF family n=1 Tax=Chryseobacterium populi TaxID=1144316 RepID=J3CM32_9FLAO|nr:RidA family protein [Chryseobacterium populi]EJL74276.1 putative translation initiation inhibitor, yjgF family [Chryseobacterium populi]
MTKIPTLICFVSLILASIGCKNDSDSKKQAEKPNQKTAIVKEKWHWDNTQKQNESAGYAQVVKAGNTIYISGIPTDDLSPEGIAKVYKALEKCLNSFGATSENVVKENLYTTDIETMKKYNDSRKEFYKGDFPAATWVQISRLYEPNAKLEIELIAQLSDASR